jgi:phospholipid/cholesterol/gamma-HCH transport system permease protein
MRWLLAPIAALGRAVLALLGATGRISIFAWGVVRALVRPPFYWREFGSALMSVGWLSLPVVGMTAIFTGGALALQIYSGGARFNAEAVVPQIVAIGMVRELGPVLVGLMIAARVTSSIAAMQYLTLPRVLAGLVCVPVLVGVGDLIGIMGGYLVATGTLGFNPSAYLINTVNFLELRDVVSSLAKGAVFGVIATLMGCYYGMNSGRGAQGVGAATKGSVEAAAIMILAANFLLTGVFFSL